MWLIKGRGKYYHQWSDYPTLKYLVNVGSVGQPKCIDKRVQYVIMDDEAHSLDVRLVDCDPWKTIQKMNVSGISHRYAACFLP